MSFSSLSTGMKALIINTFVVAFASFMITPFLAVYLEHAIGLPLRLVGSIVALATFIQFGGGVVGGWAATRFGLKPTMVYSLAIRAAGLVLLAAAISVPSLVIPAVILVALGPALYLPANRAFVVQNVGPELRPVFLSISNAALNAGMALGPLIAAVVITDSPAQLIVALGIIFAGLAIAHQYTVPSAKKPEGSRPSSFSMQDLPEAIRKGWRPILLCLFTYYSYFHFQSFMGLYASRIANLRVFSACTLLNFSILFFLQPLLANRIAKAHYREVFTFGFLIMGIGMGILSIGTTSSLLVGTAIMTLGQSMLFLRCDLEMVEALSKMPAMAFGIQRLCAGVGGLLSGLVGGVLFEQCSNQGSLGKFWLIVAAQGIFSAAVTYVLSKGSLRPRQLVTS